MIVCTRLILDDNAVAGANATVYRHYDNATRPALAHTTGLHSGVADFIFYTGAPLGRPDRLEAVVSYQGVVYRATVSP